MTMPKVPERTQEQAIVDVIVSIALEETALAHLVNAEAEKIQEFLNDKRCTSLDDMLELQQEVRKMLRTIVKKEMLLQFKLEDLKEMKEQEEKKKRRRD